MLSLFSFLDAYFQQDLAFNMNPKWVEVKSTIGQAKKNTLKIQGVFGFGGRYMDRTCDPCSVNAVLYR
jgi:hypothetical protein